jgi:uridine kinase
MKKPFVISVAAPSCGGKTTLTGELHNQLANATVLFARIEHS